MSVSSDKMATESKAISLHNITLNASSHKYKLNI